METPPNRRRVLGLLLLVTLAFIVDTVVAVSMSKTTDEDNHLDYGKRILRFQPDRANFWDSSKMPVIAFNAMPSGVAKILDSRHVAPSLVAWLRTLYAARLPTVLATLLLILYVYRWANDLYGPGPALVAAILAMLSPNIIAHGTLATTDLYFALGIIVALYYFRRYLLQPTLRNACLSGLTLALAQLTKSFSILLYGLPVCFLLLPFVFGRPRPDGSTLVARKNILSYFGIALLFLLIVLNVGFCFDRPFTPLGAYRFENSTFIRLQRLPVLRSLPVPVPYPFLQGLDMMKNDEQTGLSLGHIYLLGQLRSAHDASFRGFKSYYAVALFFKEPIALQVLFVLGLVWAGRNRRLHDFLVGEGLLLAPAAVLLAWLSFFNREQIGIRHLLPFFAIDIIVGAAAFVGFNAMSHWRKAFLGVLVLWLGVSVASYYPQMIPYMNEWVFDRKLAYKIVADSNLDWGQNAEVVEKFLKNNPDVIKNPEVPVAGRILVGVNILVGIPRQDHMLWLRSRYQPVAHVGYGDLLFIVPESDLQGNSIRQ
jgi:4-amino-4-deoxy-L-arabinose transferase-like glycosyltransferase